MSESHNLTIAKNMAFNEGVVSGYFAVQSDYSGVSGQIMSVAHRLEDYQPDALCIPIIIDEFGCGRHIIEYLLDPDMHIGGLASFGADESEFSTSVSQYSHTEVVCLELGQARPDFLAVLLKKPGGIHNDVYRKTKPFDDLHMHYGNISVQGQACVIEVTDELPPLK